MKITTGEPNPPPLVIEIQSVDEARNIYLRLAWDYSDDMNDAPTRTSNILYRTLVEYIHAHGGDA